MAAQQKSKFRLKPLRLLSRQAALSALPEGKLLVNTLNAHSYNMARKDAAFAEALQKGDVLIPDGKSVVWASKLLHPKPLRVQERCAGWDLFVFEMQKLAARGGSCMFLGSSPEVLEKIRERTAKEFPSIQTITFSPPYKAAFNAEDNAAMIDAVNSANPGLLWIGMTAPKQEKWAWENWDALDINCHCGCIGAVFDFYAGTAGRAPEWMQKAGLEWLYRLLGDPGRLWKRYIIGNARFIFSILTEI